MNAYGVDDESGLVHSVVGTAANVADITQVDKLLHGNENVVCADAGYTGVEKRPEHAGREVIWQVAARRSTYKKLDKRSALYKAKRKIEKAKVRIPRHPATQSALIWPGIPRPSGHLFHGHPAGQSERSDAGVALLV